MREKNKKILKVIGVGALACVGMVGLTGCSVDLTQEQMDKIMYTVDNSDTFMQESLDLLNKQNAKMDAEEAYNLCKLAYQKIYQNYQGLRDNLVINVYEENNETPMQTMISYSINGNDVIINVDDEGTYMMFEEGGTQFGYYKEGNIVTQEILSENIHYLNNWYGLNFIRQYGLTSNDVASCEILDNGNYQIIFVQSYLEEDEDNQVMRDLILDVEITTTGEYVTVNSYCSEQEPSERTLIQEYGTITFEYGTVDVEYVTNLLNEAHKYKVLSDSMYPTFSAGDTVYIEMQDNYVLGDIVLFMYDNAPVIHRIIGIKVDEITNTTYYVCHGDAVQSANPANSGTVDWMVDSAYVDTLTYEQIVSGEAVNVQVIELSQIIGAATLFE